ncbi:hypothetical protein [Actinospica sp.]|jgi:hypothetical protein|uniref:hypothetical protein n=1 Tax=Actinospica sp. TaxID=1872142 RepID=UPI002BBA2CA2|nr:hypothetical protein [Actinospica sp.]HWG25933.1 hypothetical protein [Actinospica sp.]
MSRHAVYLLSSTRRLHILSVDPTNHGSNFPVVAALAVAILALIGLLVFLLTRRGGPRSR